MPDVTLPEPWLRGPVPDVHPVISHLLRASEQIREETASALASLSPPQIWAKPARLTSAGFHAKHLAGSTRRLSAYLAGRELTEAELKEGALESEGSDSAEELIAAIDAALNAYDSLVLTLQSGDFETIRHVGRRRLPVTAISLAIHIAEHGQRHVGQLISAAKLAASLLQPPDGHGLGASGVQS